MASMKTMMMVSLDVSPSMGQPVSNTVGLNEKRITKVELAKNFVSLFILQRAIASKTAEFGVITFGSGNTHNYLNSSQDGYEGIDEIVPMERPTKTTFQQIHQIEVGTENVDLIDAVVVAQDVLMRVNASKAFNRIMLLITDGESPVEGVDDLEAIVEQMKNVKNFGLYIAMMGKVNDQSSIIKKENVKLLQSFADSVGGRFMEIQGLSDSIHLLSGGLGLGTRPTLSKTFLEITPNLRIPCVYWSQVSKVSPPTLKKQPKADTAAEDDAMDEETAAGAIKRDITYRTPDDLDVEISLEERVKGYRYGSQYIPVTTADEENFKIAGSPVIQVIGCLPREKIPRNHFLDTPSYVHPNVDSEPAQYIFGAFVQGVFDQQKVCLARLVKRENSDPSLVALIPKIDDGTGAISLLMYRIPFSDDIREYNFPSLVAFASEKQVAKNPVLQKQRQSMSEYIDAMTVRPATKSFVSPVNPTLQTVYSSIHQRLLQINETDKIYVPDLVALTKAPEKQVFVDQIYDIFKLEKVEKKSKRKKVFWSDVDTTNEAETAAQAKRTKFEIDVNQISAAINAPVNSSSNLPPSKSNAPKATGGAIAVKIEPGVSSSSSSSAPVAPPSSSSSSAPASSSQVAVKEEAEEEEEELNLPDFTVGSVTPVEDFQAHIEAIRQLNPKNRKQRILKAMQIVTKIIQRNVALGGSRTHYKRAVSCLVALRSISKEEKEYELFNNYLQTFKTNYQKGRHALAWQLATDQLITLISKDEVKSSNITDDEAEQFLADIDNEGREDEEDDEGAV